MLPYDITTYGERYAEVYDEWFGAYEEDTISTLAEMAGGGRALELGIGTGRVALPLLAKGVEVHGIDSSPAMVAKLRAKPDGEKIPVAVGDFADVSVEGEFSLIYVVLNTFTVLLTQEEQVRCFANAARHLAPGGLFLVEAFVPDLNLFRERQTIRVSRVTTELASLHVAKLDLVSQRVTGQQVAITDGGVHLYPIQIRYAWPSEIDLMARLAGMRLRHRWGNWRREDFTSQSDKHISGYAMA